MSDRYLISSDGLEFAMQVTEELVESVAVWCGGIIVEEIDPETSERFRALNLVCGDEVKRASANDWVIKKADKTFDVSKRLPISFT